MLPLIKLKQGNIITSTHNISTKFCMMFIMILIFQVKVPEEEKDPGPSSIPLKYEQDKIHTPIVDFRTWIAYIEEIKLRFFSMLLMFLTASIKVPKVKFSPGPYEQYPKIAKENSHHSRRIVPQVLENFRTWIAYIHRLLKYCLSVCTIFVFYHPRNFICSLIFQQYLQLILAIYKLIKLRTLNKEVYVYHDHYMISLTSFKIPKLYKHVPHLHGFPVGMPRKKIKFKLKS